MNRLAIIIMLLGFLACRQETDTVRNASTADYPTAQKAVHTFEEHGTTRTDPYFWLNDKTDPEVIALLEAENAFTEKSLEHTEELQKELYEELVARIPQQDQSLPIKKNGYWYYTRYDAGNEYPYYCRRKGSMEAAEEIILNVNEMAEGYQIYRLFDYFVSPDNQQLAFLVDTSGDRRNSLFFKDLSTGELLPDQVSNCSDSGAWSADGKYFFYSLNDETVRSYRVMRHRMSDQPDRDQEIYAEPDSTYSVGINTSWDKRFILISSNSTTTTETWFIPADQPLAQPKVVVARQAGLEYYVESFPGNEFYILNNHQAKNFKISTAPINDPGLAAWKDLVPHQPGTLINDFTVREKFLVVEERTNALDRIRVIRRNSGEEYYIDFGEEVYTASMTDPSDEFDSDSIRYEYTSLTTPESTIGYSLSSKHKELLKQERVGGGYDATLYETKRLWAPASDGTKVPMSIVYRKDNFQQDGSNPCLLYAYGSYGAGSMPYFRPDVISLLDRGFVFALAHIRGGQEMGREWYEDGKLLNKKNTFTDFVDGAQYLVDEKYTNAEGLFAMGRSAGGMLMGAVVNMRPDLFKGIIAGVPWMDVITDMMNPDLPLTTLEYDEWGDPNKKEYYDYMLSWSPYDNVQAADFPAILATGGLNDTQVPYFSPAKWVQKIRENNTGSEPILLQVNMGAGHGGESGRFARQKETAMIYAFMIDQVGMKVVD
jgi:oligopeptidase B